MGTEQIQNILPGDYAAETIAAVRAEAERAGALSGLVLDACSALAQATGVTRSAHKRFARLASDSAQAVNAASDAAARAVPPGPPGFDFTTAQQTARSGSVANAGRAIKAKVEAEFDGRANTAAAECARTMQALSDAVDKAMADATSGNLFGQGMSLQDLLAEQRLAAQLRSRGVQELAQRYDLAIRHKDVEQQLALEAAGTIFLDELLRMPQPKRGVAAVSRTGNDREIQKVSEETTLARLLLARMEQARRQRIPPAVVVAAQLFEALRQLFQFLVGVDPRQLDPVTFARRFMQPDSVVLAEGAERWSAQAGWPLRFVNPAQPIRPPTLPTLGNS
ncbi:MAG TPA: hypothetical protein VHK47_02065 [Polyangia bacterium]|nr:hypothetical protein [Polyangia bacterium]